MSAPVPSQRNTTVPVVESTVIWVGLAGGNKACCSAVMPFCVSGSGVNVFVGMSVTVGSAVAVGVGTDLGDGVDTGVEAGLGVAEEPHAAQPIIAKIAARPTAKDRFRFAIFMFFAHHAIKRRNTASNWLIRVAGPGGVILHVRPQQSPVLARGTEYWQKMVPRLLFPYWFIEINP